MMAAPHPNQYTPPTFTCVITYGEETDREFPYQVPESMIFVMGDNRRVSVDSRSKAIGNVAEEQIVGKIVFRVWPLNSFGPVE